MVRCFLDLEFNLSDANAAMGRNNMECISMGACFIDDDFNHLENFYSLIKPKRNLKLGHYYAKLTHLKQEDINKANDFLFVMDKFSKILCSYDEVTIYTWGNEDKRMLFRDMKTNSYDGELRKIFKNIVDLQEVVSNSIRYDGMVIKKQWSLKDMQILYNNPQYENHHNAMVDAVMLKDVYVAYKSHKDLNKDYLNGFIRKNEEEKHTREEDFETAKKNYYCPNRIETYNSLKGWDGINREFLKKYPSINIKYYNCKKIIVTIKDGKIDFYYVLNKDDVGHLRLIIDPYNFRRIRRYIGSLDRIGEKDIL